MFSDCASDISSCAVRRGDPADRCPQEHAQEEHRRHRLAICDTEVCVAQRGAHEAAEVLVDLEFLRGGGEHPRKQAVLAEQIKGLFSPAAAKQLQKLVEQPCGRHVGEQRDVRTNGTTGGLFDGEIEFRGKAHGAQHAYRVLTQTLVRIADQDQAALIDVAHAVDVVPDAEVGNVVIERIAGEVAAPDVLFDGAVDVVAQDTAFVVVRNVVVLVNGGGPKGRYFDDLAAESHMCEPEPPADEPAIAEQSPHLVRRRVGRNVEVLRVQAEQCIPHTAADQEGLVTGLVQSV